MITPIVFDADKKSLTVIGETVRALASKAKAGTLKPAEFMGGSFSVSNLGMFPVDHFSAILNPPQGAIMAVGRGTSRVHVNDDGTLGDEAVASVTVSADARVCYEADVARFLEAFREEIEADEWSV